MTSLAQEAATQVRAVLAASPTLQGLCGFSGGTAEADLAARIWVVDAGDDELDPAAAPLILLSVTPGDTEPVDGARDLLLSTIEVEADIYLPEPAAATPADDFLETLELQAILGELYAAEDAGELHFEVVQASLSPIEREEAERDVAGEMAALLLIGLEAYHG